MTRKIRFRDDLPKIREGEVVVIEDLDLGFIEIPKKVTLILRGEANVEVFSVGRVEARERSKIRVLGTSVALLFDDAKGEFYGSSSVYLRDKSKGFFFKKSRADLTHQTFGMFYEQSEGTLTFSAKGVFLDYSRGVLKENALGRFYDNSEGVVLGNSEAEFFNWSLCRIFPSLSSSPKIKLHGDSKKIKKVFKVKDLEKWIKWNNIECLEKNNQKFAILYKWVRTDYKDFYSGTIDYSQEEIVAPDWDPEYDVECGRGLHLASDPWMAYMFKSTREGRMLKFKVPIEDLYPYLQKDVEMPYKVRVPKLKKYIAELKLFKNEWIEIQK